MPVREKRKRPPTNPLRCSNCGGTRIKVTRATQMLSRRFRRDVGGASKHLHASCECLNRQCQHRWWSAHEAALREAERLNLKAKHGGPGGRGETKEGEEVEGVHFGIVDSAARVPDNQTGE